MVLIFAFLFAQIFTIYFEDESHWYILQKSEKREINVPNMFVYSFLNLTTLGMSDILPKSFETRFLSTFLVLITYIIY